MSLALGFPVEIRDEARAVAALMPPAPFPPSFGDDGQILISGEPVQVPYRHYAPEPAAEVMAALNNRQRTMMHCLYTRHHDGFVRERHLASILPATEPWIPPYVIQLLGEYVREIAQTILDRLADLDPEVYARFGEENRLFIRLTQQRIISYQACNYRLERLDEQPAFIAMQALGFWPPPAGRRLLPRRAD